MKDVITISGLVKRFGNVTALDGVEMKVSEGQVHGFLGPNGAGKSTTIRVLLGLLRHDSGKVRLLGGDPWDDAAALHSRLAYVPGDVELWPSLTGGQVIDILARLRGSFDQERREALLERFDLDPTKKCRTYSKGNRQKVALVAALASNVELLLLDEPTAGLDPLMDSVFQEVILEEKARGRTVLLSSHILAQVENLADQVSIIRKGSIVESGSLAELRHLSRTTITASTVREPDQIGTVAGVHNVRLYGSQVTLEVDGDHMDEVIGHLHGLGIHSLTSTPPTLEQLFMRHYREKINTTDEAA